MQFTRTEFRDNRLSKDYRGYFTVSQEVETGPVEPKTITSHIFSRKNDQQKSLDKIDKQSDKKSIISIDEKLGLGFTILWLMNIKTFDNHRYYLRFPKTLHTPFAFLSYLSLVHHFYPTF